MFRQVMLFIPPGSTYVATTRPAIFTEPNTLPIPLVGGKFFFFARIIK